MVCTWWVKDFFFSHIYKLCLKFILVKPLWLLSIIINDRKVFCKCILVILVRGFLQKCSTVFAVCYDVFERCLFKHYMSVIEISNLVYKYIILSKIVNFHQYITGCLLSIDYFSLLYVIVYYSNWIMMVLCFLQNVSLLVICVLLTWDN